MVELLREKVERAEYLYSKHASDRALQRNITDAEVREAVATSEVVEDYPHDKYGPSCLLFGTTAAGRPLHLQVSYPERPLVKIITLYEPDPSDWIDYRKRRTP